MNEKMKSRLIRYGITVLAGALMVFGVYGARGGFPEGITLLDRYRILSDMFLVPGLLLLMAAALVLVSNNGAFDGIGFAFSRTICRLIPGRALNAKHETYGEYLERKHGEKKMTGYSCLVVVGTLFLAVGLVFMFLFYRVYP